MAAHRYLAAVYTHTHTHTSCVPLAYLIIINSMHKTSHYGLRREHHSDALLSSTGHCTLDWDTHVYVHTSSNSFGIQIFSHPSQRDEVESTLELPTQIYSHKCCVVLCCSSAMATQQNTSLLKRVFAP